LEKDDGVGFGKVGDIVQAAGRRFRLGEKRIGRRWYQTLLSHRMVTDKYSNGTALV
jgi:hypothetical protein